MDRTRIIAALALLASSFTTPALGQAAGDGLTDAYDGLYRPAGPLGASWSCNPDSVGMDGGAMAVLDGYLEGVENSCDLTDAKPIGDETTSFTALCSAEGEPYAEDVTLRLTESGLSVQRGDSITEWARCASGVAQGVSLITTASNDGWTEGFAQGVSEISTTDADGNSITFTCNGGYDGGLYFELANEPISGGRIEIEVDGKSFTLPIWAEGGAANTECTACAGTYEALWVAAANGRMMTVTSGDSIAASFNLQGAGELLGDTACYAVGNSF